MKLLRETIRKLLQEEQEVMPVNSFIKTLAASATSAKLGYNNEIILDHGECLSILSIELDEESGEHAWVNNLYTTDTTGRPSPDCYRKGYGKQMMSLLTRAADQHGVTLELIAAPPAHMRRQDPTLPDKDELARFYAKHGFIETDRNFAQVYMRRDPK
tara:strand:+ start:1107 stop:1580 length:474 start_codon:yes stop_codon:yes gene_type:complete